MKRNLVPLLGIAFVVAVATTGIFYGLFVGKLDATATPQLSVVVAARDLVPGTPITANDLKIAPWAGKAIPKGGFSAVDEIVGQTAFDAIAEGEPVLAARIAGKNGGAGLAIPVGMRAISTHVTDSTGVLGMMRVGHRVDVQVLNPKGEKVTEAEVRTVLQNIRVLAIHPAPDVASNGGPALPSVTLLVNPAEADALAVADSTSRVRLTLRNPSDVASDAKVTVPFTTVMRTGVPAVAQKPAVAAVPAPAR
jgi:pilus assembly protein CpaB